MKNYDDIINLSRPISNHKKQSIESRAAQFAPFAALTGYDEKVKESGRLTTQKKYLDQEIIEEINNKLNWIEKNILLKRNIEIIYFVKDLKKTGGKYINKIGIIKKINKLEKYLVFTDNEKIAFDSIIQINIETT